MKKQKRQKYSNGSEISGSANVFENEKARAIVGADLSNQGGLNLRAKAVIQASENARLEAEAAKNLTTGRKTSSIGVSAQRQLGPVKLEGGAFTGTGGTGVSLTGSYTRGPVEVAHTERGGTGGRGSNTSVKYNNNNVNAFYKRDTQDGRVTNSLGAGWKDVSLGVDSSDAGTGAFVSYNRQLKNNGNVNATLNKVPGSGLGGTFTFKQNF